MVSNDDTLHCDTFGVNKINYKCEHPPRRKSLVWKYFENISKSRIKCRLCGHEQNYHSALGNILRHLKNKHQLDLSKKGLQEAFNKDRMQELDNKTSLDNNIRDLCKEEINPVNEEHENSSTSSTYSQNENELEEKALSCDPFGKERVNRNGENPPRRRSLVWKYFENINKSRIKCRLCGHEQNYHSALGNILRHLKNKHQLDLSKKGLQDVFNKERMQELDSLTNVNDVMRNSSKQKINPFNEEQFSTSYGSSQNENELEEEPLINVNFCDNGSEEDDTKMEKLKSERIIAEIEYFRAKTALMRVRRNVAILEAKKLKCEIAEFNKKKKMS